MSQTTPERPSVSAEALDTSWALKHGQIDQTLLTNFADRSQHELALVGKQAGHDHRGGRGRGPGDLGRAAHLKRQASLVRPAGGASFDYLAATAPDESGTVRGVPFLVPAAWAATFVKKNPEYDMSELTYAKFEELFQQTRTEYDDVIGTRDADLSAFRDTGGKLLTWHGTRDQLIPTAGTVDYRRRVECATGGDVDDFIRLFLAPGTEHCGLSGGRPTISPR
nr:tannase/feruloyl esterase family alpha/beta hydrolase [Nonomuraea sediminis]